MKLYHSEVFIVQDFYRHFQLYLKIFGRPNILIENISPLISQWPDGQLLSLPGSRKNPLEVPQNNLLLAAALKLLFQSPQAFDKG